MSYTYTSVENRTLVDLIKKYQTHVLNTSTKKFAVENRNKSWAKITAEFNKTGTTEVSNNLLSNLLSLCVSVQVTNIDPFSYYLHV